MSIEPVQKLRVLFLEDDPNDRELVARALAADHLDCEFTYATTERGFLEGLDQPGLDLILCDYTLPAFSGSAALAITRQSRPDLPFIIVSGTLGEQLAVAALKAGATDYVSKDDLPALAPAVRRALREVELRRAQQQAQADLRASEHLLRAIIDNIPDPVWYKGADGRYLADNEPHARFFGRTPHDMLGKTFSDLMPHQARVTTEEDARVLATAKPTSIEERLVDAQGKVRWFETTKSPVLDEHGRVAGTVGIAREITERIHAHQELKASEERFRSVWENSIDGMRLLDRAGRIIAVNDAYCRLVKMPREKLVGQLLSIVYRPGGDDAIDTYRHRFNTGAVLPRYQAKVTLWNNEELDLDIASSFIQLAENRKLVFSIFRDVTQTRAAELRSLAFSRLGHKLSAALSAREAGEIITDVADQLLGWDACWFGLYDPAQDKLHHVLNIDTVNGRRAFVPPAPNANYLSPVARHVLLFGGQLILKANSSLMLPDSRPFGDTARPSASLLFVPVRKGAEVVGILSIQSYKAKAYNQHSLETLQALADHCGGALDRIRSDETLQATRQRFNHLLQEAPAVIYSRKIDGPQAPFSWISSYVLQLLGFSVDEASQPDWWTGRLHPDDRQLADDSRPALLRLKQITRDYRLRHKNGDYRWIRDEQRLVSDLAGQPLEIVGSWVDITERKNLEDLLRQSQKLDAIGKLAAGVAHDFNNLLVVMRGNADLLLMHADRYPAQARDALEQIIAAAERAANLTRQLLAFGSKHPIQPRPLLLNDAVANLVKMLERVIGETIKLQCDFSPTLPFVQADPCMLEQVLLNLVLNARDAMPAGGRLLIATSPASLSEADARANPDARPGQFACLSVTDTGPGIAPEHLPFIFEPFFTTKQPGHGTGLGLPTAYGIVKQHHGWLQVTTAPGQGATFKIFLPAAPAPAAQPSPQAETPPAGGHETILLVEDDYPVRVITRRVLESFGYTVHDAAHAREARDLWNRAPESFSLLLADVVLPEGSSGRELADQLRAQRPNLKVLFLSGYSAEVVGKDTDFFRRAGNRFIRKPCPADLLVKTVRLCLDEKP